VISIRKSLTDLEHIDELTKCEALAATIRDCYTIAISSSAHYAVEVDPHLAAEFRSHLQLIGEQSRSAASLEQLRSVQSSFRGELREYRDKSVVKLTKMRKEVESATAAMMIFADTVASNGANHDHEVKVYLNDLQSTARKDSIEEIRGGVTVAVAGIGVSVEHLQRDNQLLIAQLQDEIRALHQQIEQERKILYTDRMSGAWNRQKIDLHLDNLLRQNQPFCLLLVCVRNYKRIVTQYSPAIVEGTLKALVVRFAAVIGEGPVIGRWTEEQFVAVLDMPAGDAIRLSAEANQKLSGSYSVQENGLAQKVVLHATAGIIDRATGSDSSSFLQKLEQLAEAIAGA
jgi:GGDEF domain-containing protein